MNEIELSTDLKQIELEINHHKQIAGQAIWEIGRRLNHVKEKDLAHGEFIGWYETFGFEKTFVQRTMKVAREIPNSATLHYLGETALYLIATLPDEQKKEQLEKAEQGEPSTVRELQDLKKQLRKRDEEISNLTETIDLLGTDEPEIIEKPIEVVPDDYEDLKKASYIMKEVQKENKALKAEQSRLKSQVEETSKALNSKKKMENDDIEQAQLKRLQRDADINVHKLIINMNNFVKEQAVTVYDSEAILCSNDSTKKKLTDSIVRVEKLLTEIKREMGGEVVWVHN